MDEARPAALIPAQADPQRAWRKLAAARKRTEAPSPLVNSTALRRYSKVFLAMLFLSLMLVGLALTEPEALHPRAWGNEPLVPIGLLLGLYWSVAVLAAAVRRGNPGSAELVLRDFYGSLSAESEAAQLGEFLIPEDFDATERRRSPFDPAATAKRICWGQDLDAYWNSLFKSKHPRASTLSVDSVRMQEIEPDLQLGYVALRVQGQSRWVDILWIAVVASLVVTPFLGSGAGYAWPLHGAATIGYFGFSYLISRLVRVVGVFRVRKLLVRSGGQWRLFCGEWEGHEEADLSWLDHPPQQEPRA